MIVLEIKEYITDCMVKIALRPIHDKIKDIPPRDGERGMSKKLNPNPQSLYNLIESSVNN
ncbi:hypothetical protein [Sodalis endosymbiont of Henestaris halophilus]|uniref:hypothetical protein n=1 Tax=Sodalis endosymbiont of Henestaris halophilus TaxID=1929246 RepID=UPI000BBF4286|nr:hypothetical protein [Sodalis endosymbiont of Henestaris halophilus]SNC58828.1 hypothetical protein HBA_0583 [Sodalis endosymbiont of Henestaris halophilus]